MTEPYTADELADDVPRTYDHRRLLATVDAERARADQAEAERDELRIAIHGGCGCPAPYDQCTHDEPLLQVVNRRWEQIQTLLATVDAERARREQGEAERDALVAELALWKDRAEASALRSIEARNPGIDMEDVRRRRALDASPTEGNPE